MGRLPMCRFDVLGRTAGWLPPSLPGWPLKPSSCDCLSHESSSPENTSLLKWKCSKSKHRLLHLATAAFFRVYFCKWSPEAQVVRMDWMFWVGLKLMQVAPNFNFSNDTTLHFSNESKPHLIVHLYSQERIQQFYLGKLKGQLGQVKRFLGPSLLCKIWDLKQK